MSIYLCVFQIYSYKKTTFKKIRNEVNAINRHP